MKNATCEQTIRPPATRQPAIPRTILRDNDSSCSYHPTTLPAKQVALMVVQSQRVVCMVEGHRHAAACSVARLLCRLLLAETSVYACESGAQEQFAAEVPVPALPSSWREIYRVSPWAQGTAPPL